MSVSTETRQEIERQAFESCECSQYFGAEFGEIVEIDSGETCVSCMAKVADEVLSYADEMEAQRDAIKAKLSIHIRDADSWRRTANGLDRQRQENLDARIQSDETLNEIRAYAAQQLPTRVIGGHHAALQKIIEMAGGEG